MYSSKDWLILLLFPLLLLHQSNKYSIFASEIVPATEGPTSTGEPTTSVKTDQVPEDAVKNAVVMTIRNVDLAEVNNTVGI